MIVVGKTGLIVVKWRLIRVVDMPACYTTNLTGPVVSREPIF